MERIVVGVDGSDVALRALRWAADEARVRGATLEVVHAWELPSLVAPPFTGVSLEPGLFEDAGRSVLDAAVEAVGVDDGLKIDPRLVRGGAARVILEAAEGADLVVIGSRGLGGFAGLLLGSVSHQVVHHATCPTVVVPQGT